MEPRYSYVVTTEDEKYYGVELWPKAVYTPISEAEFYNQSAYKKVDIQRLRKSVYPTQANDYVMCKRDGQNFPVDYKLVPLVKYLWNHHIKTEGWNQPDKKNKGFVSMDHYTKKKESTLTFLQDIFKDMPGKISVIDRRDELPEQRKKIREKIETLNKKGILIIELFSNFIAMVMNDTLLEKIYNHLGLQKNEKKLPGSVIVYNEYFKENKIVKKKH